MIKAIAVKLLYCKVIFPFVIDKCCEKVLWNVNIAVLLKFVTYSFMFIYKWILNIHVFIIGLMVPLLFSGWKSVIFIDVQIVPPLASEYPFRVAFASFQHVAIILWALLYLQNKMVQAFCTLPPSALASSFRFLLVNNSYEADIWILIPFIAVWMLLFLGPLSEES